MSGRRNKANASETMAERAFNVAKRNGFAPRSVGDELSQADYTIAAQAEQIRTLQRLLTQARRENAKLIAIVDAYLEREEAIA